MSKFKDRIEERRRRLTQTGMWDTYVTFRERLKRAGIAGKIAAEYADLACRSGVPYPLTPDRFDLGVACACLNLIPHGPGWNTTMQTGVVPSYMVPGHMMPDEPGSEAVAEETATVAAAASVPEPAVAVVDRDEPDSPPVVPAAAASAPAPEPARKSRRKPGKPVLPAGTVDVPPVEERLVSETVDSRLNRLLVAALGKKATQRAEICWVNEVLLLNVEKIDADTVPSPGAVALLDWVRQSAQNRSEFMTKLYVRTIPTRMQAEVEADEVGDDGRSVEELLEAFERQLGPVLRPGSEDAA